MDYVVVPHLPRDALIEWQIWAHRGNTRFEYEETGCVVGDNRVSIRRRWNYDNTVAAIVCYVSTGTCNFILFIVLFVIQSFSSIFLLCIIHMLYHQAINPNCYERLVTRNLYIYT